MKIALSFTMLWLMLPLCFAQLAEPWIRAEGETENLAIRAGIEQYLTSLFPSRRTSSQELVYRRILDNSAAYVIEKAVTLDKQTHRYQGTMFRDIPAILDEIVYGELLEQRQGIYLIGNEEFGDLEGFLATRHFSMMRLSAQQKESIQTALNQEKWQTMLLSALAGSHVNILIVFAPSALGHRVRVFDMRGNIVTTLTLPTQGNYDRRLSAMQILCYQLLEDMIRSILKWQTQNEYLVTFAGFSAEKCQEIRKILEEAKTARILDWVQYLSEDATSQGKSLELELACQPGIEIGGYVQTQLSLRYDDILYFVDLARDKNKLTYIHQFRWFALTIWCAGILLAILAVGCWFWRGRQRHKVDFVPQEGKEKNMDEKKNEKIMSHLPQSAFPFEEAEANEQKRSLPLIPYEDESAKRNSQERPDSEISSDIAKKEEKTTEKSKPQSVFHFDKCEIKGNVQFVQGDGTQNNRASRKKDRNK